MVDCIVVGAGPAGSTAAYHLAKRGRSVLVLEKDALPRYKPCCGGVSPAIAQWFDFDFSPVISARVDTIRYTWKLRDPVNAALKTKEPFWMVQRDEFDHFLVQQAQAQGAEVRQGTEVKKIEFQGDRWQVYTNSNPVAAPYLIAADGTKGPMAALLGFKSRKQQMAAALELAHGINGKAPVQFEFGLVKDGSIWNFPKANGASVGMSTFRGNNTPNFSKLLAEYVKLAELNVGEIHPQLHPMCFWEGEQTLHTQNALLTGDAAGIADPMTAEGIRPAMLSAVKAAEAIDAALGGDSEALARYTEAMNADWGHEMQWAQRLAGVFYRIPGIAYRVAVKQPIASEKMGQIMCGDLRYSDVVSIAVKKLSGGLLG